MQRFTCCAVSDAKSVNSSLIDVRSAISLASHERPGKKYYISTETGKSKGLRREYEAPLEYSPLPLRCPQAIFR